MRNAVSIVFVASLVIASSAASAQDSQPQARKFDEFTEGIGSPEYRYGDYAQQEQEVKKRLAAYGQELRRAGARPYAITYSPRIVPWEIYDRSVAEMRAGALWELTRLVDWRNINIVNGGFREIAVTELWIVPPGAQPPCPTPSVKPEAVVYCPFVRIVGFPYEPGPKFAIEFKARFEVNRKHIKPGFNWEVSQGEIVRGQGTDEITVKLPAASEGEVVARVTLSGFSLECPKNSVTSISRTAFGVRHYLYDAFGNIRMGDEKARLDGLALVLQNDPRLQVHIVFYGGRFSPAGEALARGARAKDYLISTRGSDADRVITIDGGYRNEVSGEYWLSIRGTGAPVTRPTVDEHYVRPKGQTRN